LNPFTEVLTCKDVIALLSDYLEATLGAGVTESLEGHLRGCDECAAYVNTYRKTRDLTARLGRVEMPAGMRERLRGFLLARLGAGTASAPPTWS
jgi:anti-sigma factor RsiW